MEWPETILKGIEDVLDPDSNNIRIHYEALDSKEFYSEDYFDEFLHYLEFKYREYEFSLILCSDNNAFDLLIDNHKSLYPDVPIVFCGVNDFNDSKIQDHKEFTGIAEEPSVLSTVELMLHLHPETEEIFIINDYLKTGRAWKKQIESDLQNLDRNIVLNYSEDLSLIDLQKKVASFSDGTLILLGVYYADKNGLSSSYEDMAKQIASPGKVPFYTLVDFNIQEGIIGGKVISGYVYGETIARIGLKILDGVKPSDIPVGSKEYNYFIFNYPELLRFGISIKDLPEQSIVLNRPFSLYEEYILEIWLTIILICSLIIALITMIFNIMNRKHSEKTLRQLSNATWEGIIIHDKGTTIQINEMFSKIFGYTQSEILGKDFIDKIITQGSHEKVRDRIISEIIDPYEIVCVRKNGTFFPAEIRVRNLEFNRKPVRVAAIRDLSEEKKAEHEYAYLQSLWDRMFENSVEAIFIQNTDGIIENVNKSMVRITGYSKEDLIGKKINDFNSEYYTDELNRELNGALKAKGSWSGEIVQRRKSGEIFSIWITVSIFFDVLLNDSKVIGVFHDISDQKKQKEELNWMSKYDALTGFSNRTVFLDILSAELKVHERSGEICALMLFNLDGLKNINTRYGFLVGDQLIKVFSERLKSGLRDEDLVSRFGGDEFAVLAPHFTDKDQVNLVIKRIREKILKSITIEGHIIDLSVSIGVSLYPSDGKGEKELIAMSGTALQRTKTNRKGFYSLFNSEEDKTVLYRSELEMQLQKSLINNELDVFYQAKVSPFEKKITGFEALVRWHRNNEEWIPPDIFIPISEGNGFIIEIGYFVINKACDFILNLKDEGFRDIHVSVNISAKQFSDPAFIDKLIEIVESKGILPSFIDLEVTESITASKVYNTIECLSRLSEYGFSISIDDFGTGYSSLQYLLMLPFDTIKIDKSFIDSILAGKDKLTILDTMISLAHSLNKKIVAEGAETLEQVDYLKQHKCELIQGFYYSKPLPYTDVLELIKSDKIKELSS